MRLVGMLQNADPFRIAPIETGLGGHETVGIEYTLHSIGVEAPVAIQVEVKAEIGRAVRDVGDHKNRRTRVVVQVEQVFADIRVVVKQLAIGVGVTDIGQVWSGQARIETAGTDEIGRYQEVVGEQVALRGDARYHFRERPGLSGVSRQPGVGLIRSDGHRHSFAAADAEEKDRHDRHHRQHDQRDDQRDTVLGFALHLAVRTGIRC